MHPAAALFTGAIAFGRPSAPPADPSAAWVEVDDPAHPDAIARSRSYSLLAKPPTDGTPWRPAAIPSVDQVFVDAPGGDTLLDAIGAEGWHRAGRRGQGARVAIFDVGWFAGDADPSAVEPFETADCFRSSPCEIPFDVERPSLTAESGNHGWACAETVRAVAPDAELTLVRVNSMVALENAVDWAVRHQIDVVSMSMSYYNQSFYDGSGPHAALLERLEAGGVLLVTSAGNNATQHAWQEGAERAGDPGAPLMSRDVWCDPGPQNAYVGWDQWSDCGATDLSARVLDARGWVLDAADATQGALGDGGADCEPVERLRPTVVTAGWYTIEVRRERGSTAGLRVDLLARPADVDGGDPTASVTDPAAHPFALAVGAVPLADYAIADEEPYSARGPTHGGAPKPDLVAPDGLSTAAYGPVGFWGTSASTPVVAGMAALIVAEEPHLSPAELRQRLRAWAAPASARPAHDPSFGAGRARLPRLDPGVVPCGQRPLLLPFLMLGGLRWRSARRRG